MALDPQLISNYLRRIPLFETLDDAEIVDVVQGLGMCSVEPGFTLFEEGDPGDAMYIIESGSVSVQKKTIQGTDETLAKLGAWAVVGEMALIDGEPRSATVLANEKVSGYSLSRADFAVLRTNLVPAAYKLIRTLARTLCDRLREINQRLTSFFDNPERALAQMRSRYQAFAAQVARSPSAKGARRSTLTPDEERLATPPVAVLRPAAADDANAVLQFLQQVPLLKGLVPSDLAVLAGILRARAFPRDATVCAAGDPGDRFYLVARGTIEVCTSGDAPQVLATLAPGQMFGHVSLIDGKRRSADCRASCDALLLECRKADFDALFSAKSPLAFRFIDRVAIDLSERIRQADARFLQTFSQLGQTIRALEQRIAARESDMDALLKSYCE